MTKHALILLALACGGKQDEAAPASGEPQGACALMPHDKLEVRIAEPQGPAHSVAVQPPLAGMCRQKLAGDLQATLTLRSHTDWDAMAASGNALAGLGEEAKLAQNGVMLKLAGKPHFFHAVVTGPSGVDQAKSIELAKIVAATAR